MARQTAHRATHHPPQGEDTVLGVDHLFAAQPGSHPCGHGTVGVDQIRVHRPDDPAQGSHRRQIHGPVRHGVDLMDRHPQRLYRSFQGAAPWEHHLGLELAAILTAQIVEQAAAAAADIGVTDDL